MPVSVKKLRTLYVMKLLLERSDEENVLSTGDLIEALAAYGIESDRKSVYSDIETLTEFGLDIVALRGGAKPGFYVGSRDFELPEVKLLVDAVQTSKFITVKKSRQLIEKIEKLVSVNQARQLQRDVFIANRVKAGNETIYYNVDKIHQAINANRQIEFQYTEWNLEKKLTPKKDGRFYQASPWVLTWDDANYYMIAYDEEAGKIKHYRVDKMREVSLAAAERLGREEFSGFDQAAFARKTFGMYGGRDVKVSLLCDDSLIGVIMDRFGTDVIIAPKDEERFNVVVTVSVSPQFFGWLSGLGGSARITGPEAVKNEYIAFLRKILESTEEDHGKERT